MLFKKVLEAQREILTHWYQAQKMMLDTLINQIDEQAHSTAQQETQIPIDEPKVITTHEEPEFSLFDYYSLTKRDDVLISYKGPVSDTILAEISRDIRDKFSENPKASKKLFSIFVELAQNILYYSSEKVQFSNRNDSIGTILITKTSKHLTFSCGNLVENKYINDLVEGCEKINSLDREELREYKRETRSAPQKERSKGAGIGLIQVALTSGNPLGVEARQVDEKYSFFSLSVKINP